MSIFKKVEQVIPKQCQYVTPSGTECYSHSTCKCHRCGIKLCSYDANVVRFQSAREWAQQRYCPECRDRIESLISSGQTEFVDVQPIQIDDYPDEMPVRRRGPVKWED